jgi:chromosome partitioning protein
MPSDIDIHATAKCIGDLLLVAKIRRSEKRIGIIANRVRSNTRVWQSLIRFLKSLDIPLVATLRDSQNYLKSAELGVGVCEMAPWQVQQDLPPWRDLLSWLAARRRTVAANVVSPPSYVTIDRSRSESPQPEIGPLAGLAAAASRELDASA